MFEQHTILLNAIILIGLYLKIVLSQCEVRILANQDILNANNNDNVLIERDSQEKLNFLDDQIQQQIQIVLDQNEKIISTQFIESLYDDFDAEKWLCQLIQIKNQYYISCVSNIYIDDEGNTNLKNEENIRLNIEISKDDQCHQFYLEENLEFLIFCNTKQNLNIYSVNLLNQTKIELSQEYIFEKGYFCPSLQFHRINFGNYLIAYIQCENWQILRYQDKIISVLSNSQLMSQIQILNSAEFCREQIVLIEDHTIYLFRLTESFNFLNSETNNNQIFYKVLFSKSCHLEYYILIQAIDKHKSLYEKYKEIQQSIDQKVIQIYSAFNYLFFQYYNKVQIFWLGDQTFEIICFPQSIVFIDQYNLIYIIDKQNQLISFYKINKLFNYLQPTKRYVYEIPKSYQKIYTSLCYEIVYEDIKTKSNIINYEFKNECQSKEEIIVKKDNYNFPNYQDFLNLGEYQNTIKYIIQNVYLKEFCPVIEQYLEENELLYYQSKNLENYAILNSNDTLQVLFCNNQSSLEKDVRNYQVIQFQNGILLIKKKLQNTKVIYYSIGLNQQHQIYINSQIQEILQFKQYVILQTENQEDYLFLDILNARQCEISNKLKNMLNLLNKDQIQSKMIRFYFDQFPLFQIYQINKQLVIEKADQIYTYKINDISVIYTGESMKLSHNEILIYKYCVIAIHNKYNIIKQYILDDSLKLLENYQIEDYDLIRPIVFQNSKEFLVIALIQQDQNYLFIFQIYQPLKLIKILKIGKLKFHLMNNLLYYYNKDQEIQIFNVKYITISYMNLVESQKQIVLNEKIPILFKHQTEENPPDQLYLEIKVNNYCRKLNSQQNEQIIYVEEKEMIRIENIDMFYGPIDQLSLRNNPKLQLVGPFLQQQEIEECLIQQEVCYTNMVFEQTVNDEQQTLFYSLRYYNKYKILPFYSIKNLKDNEIITKNAFIFRNNLVLYFSEIKKLVFADVLHFNRTQLNQQYDKLELQGFIKDDFKQAQFYQSNSLILIKTNQSEKLLKVTQNQIAEIEINFSLSNILFIENSANQYIEMKIINKLDECYFLFNIFQLKSTDLLIKDSIKIEQDKIESILFTQIDIEIYQLQEYFKNQLLESYLIENEIEIKILQIGLSFSVISKITINLNKQNNIYDTIYDIQRIIRHPKSQELLNFEYYDNNILILSNSNNKKSFLYDLRQIKQFYDYIQKIDDNLLKLYPLNTTHYLFYFKEINQFIIGEIGFEIQRLEDLDDVETCIIKASNQVSQSQFTLIIKRVMFLSKETKIMTTSAILLGSFYLLRRNKLKQQEIQNQISINSQISQLNNE